MGSVGAFCGTPLFLFSISYKIYLVQTTRQGLNFKMKYRVLKDHRAIMEAVFSEIVMRSQVVRKSQIAGGVNVALLGGSTVDFMVSFLNENLGLNLEGINFFMGDERLVPLDSSENNSYRFLRNLRVKTNLIRVDTSLGRLGMKRDYLARLGDCDALDGFDFMILGVGTDGHTLSVFPRDLDRDLCDDFQGRRILDFYVREGDGQVRMGFTIPFAMRAKRIFFIALGVGKREIVREVILDGNRGLPVTVLLMDNGNSILFSDRDAGKLLEECRDEK